MNELAATLFKTPLGWTGILWNQEGVVALQLPEKTRHKTHTSLIQRAWSLGTADINFDIPEPQFVVELKKKISRHFSGKPQDFSKIPLSLNQTTDFFRGVYLFCQFKIGSGNTKTYGEIARALGRPGAARAIGLAMAKNPVPVVIPCHRVLGVGKNRLVGFSAPGGLNTKTKLLALEGVSVENKI